MAPKRPGRKVQDKAAELESQARIDAAQARRDAGLLKSKIVEGADLPVDEDGPEEDQKQPTVFELLVRHKYVGMPLRMVQAYQEKKRRHREAVAAREAKRVWDMMMLLEPGTRVKLVHVGRIGGVKYDGKLATVVADVGSRYAVRLDAVDPDGTVHVGQGAEIKISAHNMEIYDEEVEQQLAEQELLAKIKRKEERAQLFKDMRQGNWQKIMGQDEKDESTERDDASQELVEEEAVVEFEQLNEFSSLEELRLFHKQKKMKVWLGKHDPPEEMFEKIKEEWANRLDAIKKYNRSLMDAEAAINVGIKVPSVRDDFRRFITNPAFGIASVGLKDAREQLMQLLSRELTKGTLRHGDLQTVRLDARPSEKGGASMEDKMYDGKQLLFTGGMAAGQYGVIHHYIPVDPLSGEERVCEILHWYTATPDKTTKYRILNADYEELHVKGKARNGDKSTITLAENADSMKNSYRGMLIKITKGPGKSQRAKILAYDGETKQCLVDKWIWDKSIMEKAFDQDDDNIPTVPPTGESYYHLKMEDQKGRTVPLHLDGRSQKDGFEGIMFLAKNAPDFDMYSGRTVVVTGGKGKGQRTRIISYDTGLKRCKVESWQAAVPDKTSKYSIIESEYDERLFNVEQQWVKMEAKARAHAVKDEQDRKNKIRRRMWAAVRMHMMAEREGASLEEQRMVQAAEAWAALNDDAEVEDDGNMQLVNGKSVKCTWKSIVLDSEPAYEEVEVIASDEECAAVLHIKILQARNLLAADSGGTSDPYVRIHIGDDIKKSIKTKAISKTLNPVWNETFQMQVPGELRPCDVTVEVFDKDMIGKDDSLGKFTLALPSMKLRDKPSGTHSAQLLHSSWHTFDPVPKEHPSDPDNNGEIEIQYELIRKERDEDDGSAPLTKKQLRPGHLSWKGYTFKLPLYSTVERNQDGSVKQPLLILNADTGQQLYKGNTSHWKVWQSLLEEGEQLDDRDDVFRWHGRLLLQPFTTIDEEGRDIYTIVDNETGQIFYSGPDLEPNMQEMGDVENQLNVIQSNEENGDSGIHLKKDDDERRRLREQHDIERSKAVKALTHHANTSVKLKLTVVEAKDLIASDRGGTSDPYCVLKANMGGSSSFFYENMTKVVKKTLNPQFNENFDIHLNAKQSAGVLSIEVFDKDAFDADDSLGHFDIPLNAIAPLVQHDTWKKLEDTSIREGQPENKGQVRIKYQLIPELPPASLQIEILRAKDLMAADAVGTSDPYVFMYVGNESEKRAKTSVKKKTLNPEWGEKFELYIRSEQRRDLLHLECVDFDAATKHDSLGKFTLALDDIVPAEQRTEWLKVQDPTGDNKGQIEVKYTLLPVLGPAMLEVQVLRARNLLAADRGGTSDPYVRLHVGDQVSAAVKTTVKKKTLEPVWDETFSIRLESEQRRRMLCIECFDKDLFDSDDSLGYNTLELDHLVHEQIYKEWFKLRNVADGGPDNEGEIELKYKLQEIKDQTGGEDQMASDDTSNLPVHVIGGQEWVNIQDPGLWKALLDESIEIPGEEDKFSWRGIICHQPARDGPNQVVESVLGQVVFFGPNPNESVDFPSIIEQEAIMRERKLEAKGKINKMAIETEDGKYEGGMRQGQFQGDGTFIWNDGMVYSGQYVDDIREGTGTEIFPAYDNTRTDAEGEKTFPYYEGQFLDGMRHGKGIYFYAEGDFYKGMWQFNLPDGEGVYAWEDGDYLECNYRAGKPLDKKIKTQKKKPTTAGSADNDESNVPEKKKKKKKKKEKKDKKDDPNSPGGGYGFEGRAVKF